MGARGAAAGLLDDLADARDLAREALDAGRLLRLARAATTLGHGGPSFGDGLEKLGVKNDFALVLFGEDADRGRDSHDAHTLFGHRGKGELGARIGEVGRFHVFNSR